LFGGGARIHRARWVRPGGGNGDKCRVRSGHAGQLGSGQQLTVSRELAGHRARFPVRVGLGYVRVPLAFVQRVVRPFFRVARRHLVIRIRHLVRLVRVGVRLRVRVRFFVRRELHDVSRQG
jgi:hypothetical protein